MNGIRDDSYPVFYASRLSAMNGKKNFTNVVTYDSPLKLNNGDSMNGSTGIFQAPKSGIYYFSFTGLKAREKVQATVHFIKINNATSAKTVVAVGHANSSQLKSDSTLFVPIYVTINLFLAQGDQVYVRLFGKLGVLNTSVSGDDWAFQSSLITFTGFLVQAGRLSAVRNSLLHKTVEWKM